MMNYLPPRKKGFAPFATQDVLSGPAQLDMWDPSRLHPVAPPAPSKPVDRNLERCLSDYVNSEGQMREYSHDCPLDIFPLYDGYSVGILTVRGHTYSFHAIETRHGVENLLGQQRLRHLNIRFVMTYVREKTGDLARFFEQYCVKHTLTVRS